MYLIPGVYHQTLLVLCTKLARYMFEIGWPTSRNRFKLTNHLEREMEIDTFCSVLFTHNRNAHFTMFFKSSALF